MQWLIASPVPRCRGSAWCTRLHPGCSCNSFFLLATEESHGGADGAPAVVQDAAADAFVCAPGARALRLLGTCISDGVTFCRPWIPCAAPREVPPSPLMALPQPGIPLVCHGYMLGACIRLCACCGGTAVISMHLIASHWISLYLRNLMVSHCTSLHLMCLILSHCMPLYLMCACGCPQVNLLEYVLDAVGSASQDPKIFARLVMAQVSFSYCWYEIVTVSG